MGVERWDFRCRLSLQSVLQDFAMPAKNALPLPFTPLCICSLVLLLAFSHSDFTSVQPYCMDPPPIEEVKKKVARGGGGFKPPYPPPGGGGGKERGSMTKLL